MGTHHPVEDPVEAVFQKGEVCRRFNGRAEQKDPQCCDDQC